jgi:hypothetical protein
MGIYIGIYMGIMSYVTVYVYVCCPCNHLISYPYMYVYVYTYTYICIHICSSSPSSTTTSPSITSSYGMLLTRSLEASIAAGTLRFMHNSHGNVPSDYLRDVAGGCRYMYVCVYVCGCMYVSICVYDTVIYAYIYILLYRFAAPLRAVRLNSGGAGALSSGE